MAFLVEVFCSLIFVFCCCQGKKMAWRQRGIIEASKSSGDLDITQF